MKYLIAAVLLTTPLAAAAQATGNCNNNATGSGIRQCADSQTISTSGNTITIQSNGGLVPTFEEVIAGAPTTVSITIQGCGPGGTCETLDTNTTVANALRAPGLMKTYSSYKVSATWTGGTNVSVNVNTLLTSARLGGPRQVATITLLNQAASLSYNPISGYTATASGFYAVTAGIRSTSSAGGTVTGLLQTGSATTFGSGTCSGTVSMTNLNSAISCVGAQWMNAGEVVYVQTTYSTGPGTYRLDAAVIRYY